MSESVAENVVVNPEQKNKSSEVLDQNLQKQTERSNGRARRMWTKLGIALGSSGASYGAGAAVAENQLSGINAEIVKKGLLGGISKNVHSPIVAHVLASHAVGLYIAGGLLLAGEAGLIATGAIGVGYGIYKLVDKIRNRKKDNIPVHN
jgi:hypothetical protein